MLVALRSSPVARRTVGAVVDEVIQAEGPIQRDRLVNLVGRCFDLQRVSAARATDILGTVGIGPGAEFIWPRGLDPEAWRGFRRSVDSRSRPVLDVAPQEVLNAMCAIASVTRGMAQHELEREALAVFGVSRRGVKVADLMERVIDMGLSSGRLVRRDDFIVAG